MTEAMIGGIVGADGSREAHPRNVKMLAHAHDTLDSITRLALNMEFHGSVALRLDINEGIVIGFNAITEQQHRR